MIVLKQASHKHDLFFGVLIYDFKKKENSVESELHIASVEK